MMVYYSGVGVALKGIRRHIKSSFTTIAMHVDAIFVFAWTPWYEALRYVFFIRMCFEGHLMHIDMIMWSVLMRHKP